MDVTLTGSEITINYSEPTTNKNGSALGDLEKTSIYTQIGADVVKQKEVPATSVSGGGAVSEKIVVAVSEDAEVDVAVWATASDKVGNESIPSQVFTVRIDHLAPSSPL